MEDKRSAPKNCYYKKMKCHTFKTSKDKIGRRAIVLKPLKISEEEVRNKEDLQYNRGQWPV